MQADQLNPIEKLCLKLGKKKNHYSIFFVSVFFKTKGKTQKSVINAHATPGDFQGLHVHRSICF